MKKLFLLCNAHLDPVWQWSWEEGAAEALSTFRSAATLLEDKGGYVFCHNEALLYRWIEEYEPALFERIRDLVKAGKWHIMGGWYLQPDANLPSGESIIRQMRAGRRYFSEKFGVPANRTAVNFDSFGHSRGLVQLLQKAGYDSYLFTRPSSQWMPLPDDFVWEGLDGSRVIGHHLDTNYNSALGGAGEKLKKWLADHPDKELGLLPWGVGNHGGGPSRRDIDDLNKIAEETADREIVHGTPEEYFDDLRARGGELPTVQTSLRPSLIGCYTSQSLMKREHRALEGELCAAERMLTAAEMAGLIMYPQGEIDEAERDLMMSEFHDILPGTSVQTAEEASLRLIGHGREIAARLLARAFFALTSGQEKAEPGVIPLFAYNPHPWPVEGDFACEFMLADQNWKDEFTMPRMTSCGAPVPLQCEKENSNLPLDWRKRVIFHATLPPMRMSRFDCRMEVLPKRPEPVCAVEGDAFVFRTERIEVQIGRTSGLVERYRADGVDYVKPGACRALVIRDNEDPWAMNVDRFRDVMGAFEPMDERDCARFCGVKAETLPAVHVVEDGDVRTVIEACFRYGHSTLLMTYRLPKFGAQVEVEARAVFVEKDRMLKLSFPTPFAGECMGESICGWESLPTDGQESPSLRWTAAADRERALTVIDDGVYGCDFCEGEMRLSLMRTAAYTAHPIFDRDTLPQNRFSARIDNGERVFRFRIEGGAREERLAHVGREAAQMNEKPMALGFFPSGDGALPDSAAVISGDTVEMMALRPACDGHGYAVRVFEPSGKPARCTLTLPSLNAKRDITLSPFEVKTLRAENGVISDAELLI